MRCLFLHPTSLALKQLHASVSLLFSRAQQGVSLCLEQKKKSEAHQAMVSQKEEQHMDLRKQLEKLQKQYHEQRQGTTPPFGSLEIPFFVY